MDPETPKTDEKTEATQALHRDVTSLIATVDQHSAEIDTLNVEQLVLVFAFGALAGLVFLQHRRIAELADAVTG